MAIISNPKWELFAQGLAKGMSQAQAYLAAGYNTNHKAATVSASRLWENPIVRDRTAELLADRDKMNMKAVEVASEELNIDKKWVMGLLKENVEKSLQKIPVHDAEGNVVEYKYEGSVANKALELIGKEMGMFIDRKEIGGPGDFARMNDDELEKFIAERRDALESMLYLSKNEIN